MAGALNTAMGHTTDRLLEVVRLTRPRLTGMYGDENAGEVMGAVTSAIKEIGRTCDFAPSQIREACDRVRSDMWSGDNEHLLEVASEYVKFDGEA